MAETTPGPLIQVVQFVGFLGAYRSPGALAPLARRRRSRPLLTTWVTYVPCFLWIFVGAPYVERAAREPRARAARSPAITAAVVGVILNLAIWFSLHTLFAHGARRARSARSCCRCRSGASARRRRGRDRRGRAGRDASASTCACCRCSAPAPRQGSPGVSPPARPEALARARFLVDGAGLDRNGASPGQPGEHRTSARDARGAPAGSHRRLTRPLAL